MKKEHVLLIYDSAYYRISMHTEKMKGEKKTTKKLQDMLIRKVLNAV